MPDTNSVKKQMPTSCQIRVLNTQAELFQAAAVEFAALATQAVAARGRFSVALSGGSTPRGLFSLLAGGVVPDIPWAKIYFFWGDERHVPPDHPDSNYRMAEEALLSHVPVPPQNIFRIPAEEKDAETAARAYEQSLRTFFELQPGQWPRFDLIFLGIGGDGHTASLFPGTAALQEQTRLFVPNLVEKLKTLRFTLTLPVLNSAANVIFLVSGADKAPIVHELLENAGANLPAQKIKPVDGSLLWLMDRPAAAALSEDILKRPKAG